MATEKQFDAVIVGSGAGGSACAWALTRAGLRVLVLEAGPRFDPASDYRLSENDWERTRFPHRSGSLGEYRFGQMQPLHSKHDGLRSWSRALGRTAPGERRNAGVFSHVRGIGGSTLHFTGEAHRLNPASMELYSRFGVGADWPMAYEELEPHYATAERVMGVAGPTPDNRCPRSGPYPLKPHPFSYASQKLASGAASLGLSWVPNSLAVLSRPYEGRPSCNYCGGCNHGCPRTDKGSADVTFMRQAEATGLCQVITEASVTGLTPGDGDYVSELEYADKAGPHVLPLGKRPLILAAGAVETPRLLLASGGGRAEGIANESGQVGRNFLETTFWVSAGLHPENLATYKGLPSDGICWDYNHPDAIPGVVGGCRFSPATAEAGLNGPIAYARRIVRGWGAEHAATMREVFGRVLALGSIGETLPNPGSYIDLTPEARDVHGMPLARIHSHLDDGEVARLSFMADKVREILSAAGVESLVEEYGTYDSFNSTHVMGTCRMGKRPEDSVVDPYGRSHRWRNLWITDASTFPSSGGGESPSLTVAALALRTAERISGGGMDKNRA